VQTPVLSIYDQLLRVRHARGAGFVVLIDPDKLPASRLPAFAERCAQAGTDAFFLGGSLLDAHDLESYVETLKSATDLPVIGFPGNVTQVVRGLDAVLFLSIVSGRNPEYLIGQHVHAAPLVRRLGVEPIPTAYLLVESGRTTTAQYMSGSAPLPRHKPDIAAATALAAEMLGMRLLFTDAGSGADHAVPEESISAITSVCTAPLVVGGGLRTPEAVAAKVAAGASFVVVGNALEKRPDGAYMDDLAAAAHSTSRVGATR